MIEGWRAGDHMAGAAHEEEIATTALEASRPGIGAAGGQQMHHVIDVEDHGTGEAAGEPLQPGWSDGADMQVDVDAIGTGHEGEQGQATKDAAEYTDDLAHGMALFVEDGIGGGGEEGMDAEAIAPGFEIGDVLLVFQTLGGGGIAGIGAEDEDATGISHGSGDCSTRRRGAIYGRCSSEILLTR